MTDQECRQWSCDSVAKEAGLDPVLLVIITVLFQVIEVEVIIVIIDEIC